MSSLLHIMQKSYLCKQGHLFFFFHDLRITIFSTEITNIFTSFQEKPKFSCCNYKFFVQSRLLITLYSLQLTLFWFKRMQILKNTLFWINHFYFSLSPIPVGKLLLLLFSILFFRRKSFNFSQVFC